MADACTGYDSGCLVIALVCECAEDFDFVKAGFSNASKNYKVRIAPTLSANHHHTIHHHHHHHVS
jgi:hypothetical protein